MTITREESELLEKRDTELTDDEGDVVDAVMSAAYAACAAAAVAAAKDDRAARLEAALVRFLLESRQA